MSEVASEYEGEIKKARFLSRVCVRTIDHAVSVCGELVREFGGVPVRPVAGRDPVDAGEGAPRDRRDQPGRRRFGN